MLQSHLLMTRKFAQSVWYPCSCCAKSLLSLSSSSGLGGSLGSIALGAGLLLGLLQRLEHLGELLLSDRDQIPSVCTLAEKDVDLSSSLLWVLLDVRGEDDLLAGLLL